MKKKVTVKSRTYKMDRNTWTDWVFVWDKGKSYPVAKVSDDSVIEWDELNALPEVKNEDLMQAWFAQ